MGATLGGGSFAALVALMGLFLAGCAAIAPGHDPVVVRAEQTQRLAFESLNAFLRLEHSNRAFYMVKTPRVHEAAESLRRRAPESFRALRGAIVAYKTNRTPAGKASLETALAVVLAIGAETDGWLTAARTLAPKTP